MPEPFALLSIHDHHTDQLLMQELLLTDFPDVQATSFVRVEDALTHCAGASRAPQLIVLDVWLGAVTGVAALQALKRDPVTRPVPVVVLDGSESPADVEAAYLAHAAAYLHKPHDLTNLTVILRNMITYWSSVRTAGRDSDQPPTAPAEPAD